LWQYLEVTAFNEGFLLSFSQSDSALPGDKFTHEAANIEAARLRTLQDYQVLDTPPEATFDRITALAARVFNVPIAFVSLVDDERQWFKSCYGSDLQQTSRDASFCAVAIQKKDEVMVIPDATLDARFAENPLVTGAPFMRFYAGAPLVNRAGFALGSLCILDTVPRELSETERATLRDLAAVVVDELELRLAARQLREADISRLESEKVLSNSQNRFKSAFEMSASGMALASLQGQFLQVNERLCQMLGFSEEQLLARTCHDIAPLGDLPDDLALIDQLISGVTSNLNVEKLCVRSDGTEMWALVSAALVRDGAGVPDHFVAQVQDISERKQVEDDLRASEARKAAIVETALDCIVTIDAQSRILEWNPAAERTFGFPREVAVGALLHELIIPENLRGAHRAGLKHWEATGEGPIFGQRLELPAVRADGAQITVELAIVPILHSEPPLFTGHLRDISERRAVEERLRLLESVAVNANDAILITEAEPVDLPGPRILYANKSFLEMSGYTLDEIIGQTPRILQGEGTSDECRAKIRKALKSWKPIVIELLNYKKDGTPFWVELSITPVANEKGWYTHWVSIQRDISPQREILDALRESEARLGRITRNVPGMVYQFVRREDGSFTFPFVSEGSRDICDLEPGQIMADANMVTNYVVPEDAPEFFDSIQSSAQTLEAWEWEGRISVPEQGIKWIRGTSRPKREENGDIIWDGIFFDIDARKKQEELLQIAKNEAEAAREEAERANLAKSEFLSRMSHELRTPLNAILGFGQLLEMAELSEDDAQSTNQIVKAGRHLLGLINEVLDVARIESGNLSISPEAVDAREVALETLDLVRPLATTRHIVIDDAAAREASVYIHADRQRLKQILLNLLSNAVKYNREAGRITLGIEERGEKVRLSVRDTGMGIAPEMMERLGTPFDRLGAQNTGIEGTGVGLALSLRLARAMNTNLGIESEVGSGTCFWIDLPRTDDPHAAHENLAPASEPVAAMQLTVLYIEDNPSNLQLVQRLLARRPEIRLLSAMQGNLGCELASVHCPDLILLDMHLPDISGIEILARLRASPRTAEIPIVVLSADATPGQVRRALEAGAQSYLSKPLEVREFFAAIDAVMAQKIQAMNNATKTETEVAH